MHYMYVVFFGFFKEKQDYLYIFLHHAFLSQQQPEESSPNRPIVPSFFLVTSSRGVHRL